MATMMRRAIAMDDGYSASQEERLNALIVENRGLKELLAVHEHIHQGKLSNEVEMKKIELLNVFFQID